MKYLVKHVVTGKTVLATCIKKNADERVKESPHHKLITVPEDR